MIKRFPDGTAKPFLTPAEYAQLRDDDRFLYNEGTNPSARITGDKGRENPAEGAPYGEGLIGRITALEAREAELVEANQRLRNGYADAVSGYEYILQCHGRLNGVGFERVMDHFAHWVTIPEREDLVAGSCKLARATLAKHHEGEGK